MSRISRYFRRLFRTIEIRLIHFLFDKNVLKEIVQVYESNQRYLSPQLMEEFKVLPRKVAFVEIKLLSSNKKKDFISYAEESKFFSYVNRYTFFSEGLIFSHRAFDISQKYSSTARGTIQCKLDCTEDFFWFAEFYPRQSKITIVILL